MRWRDPHIPDASLASETGAFVHISAAERQADRHPRGRRHGHALKSSRDSGHSARAAPPKPTMKQTK